MTIKEIYPLGSAVPAEQIRRKYESCHERRDLVGMLICQIQEEYRNSPSRAEVDVRAGESVSDALSLGLT